MIDATEMIDCSATRARRRAHARGARRRVHQLAIQGRILHVLNLVNLPYDACGAAAARA
eukprot:SAG31_NODE_6989_length_1826_cov_1.482339_4_plen_58_part_01